jgi:hypothetical protein
MFNELRRHVVVSCIRYSTIETKEAACIGYNGFLKDRRKQRVATFSKITYLYTYLNMPPH